MDIGGQDVAVRVVAFVRGEGGFDAGKLTRLQAAASVDDLAAPVENDGVQQPVFLDVVGESLEVILVELREEVGDGMGFDDGLLVE